MKTFIATFLAIFFLISHSDAFAALEPISNLGNVDCGPTAPGQVGPPCNTKSCQSDDDCKLTVEGLQPPGGLPYGCLSDAHVCGWKHPKQPKN